MRIFDGRQRRQVDELAADWSQLNLSRRELLRRAGALGLSATAVGILLDACGTSTNTGPISTKAIDLLEVWSGEEEDSFRAVVAPFAQQTGITVNLEATRDLNAALTARIQADNPPDIAILPNPGKMQELAKQKKLIALDSFLDMTAIHRDYADAWVNLGSYNSRFYAVFYKAASKGTVWYSPTQFQANSYQIPATWQDMITLSNSIAASGKYPWSMGVSSGAASGWPAADWMAEIFLNNSGPDLYDKWVAHTIPWTDASIKSAFQMFGQIAGGTHYINGAPQSILAAGFQDASYAPFSSPPTAYMYYLGDFTAGFITGQFTSDVPGTDFNFFPFPAINSQYTGAVTGGADVVVAMRDTTAVRQLVQYMATAPAQEIWVKRGGFTSVNKSLDLTAYPNAVAKAAAQQLTQASTFRFGADDLMPSQVENAFWAGMLSFIQDQTQLGSILSSLESTAQQAYSA